MQSCSEICQSGAAGARHRPSSLGPRPRIGVWTACVVVVALAVAPDSSVRAAGRVVNRVPAASRLLSDRGNILVPKNVPLSWVNNNYFEKDRDSNVAFLLGKVEEVHLGPMNNYRGFWQWYRIGNFALAASDLNYTLWVFPNHPRALYLLEVCAQKLKNPSLPIAYYEKAVKLFPRSAYTQAQYGAYLVSIGQVPVGIDRLREALRLDPSLVEAQAWLHRANALSGASPPTRR